MRKGLISSDEKLSIRRQCELLEVNRSSLYYKPVPQSQEERSLIQKIDEIHLKYPFFGSRRITSWLSESGVRYNRKRIQRLMRIMGIAAIAPGPQTSTPAPENKVFPYLLRNRTIDKVNDVWAADITYIPLSTGHGYLVAIIDWYSRRVLSWRLSNTMDPSFCVEALDEALRRFPKPKIFNTDQGAQFTSKVFTERLLQEDVFVSMDGKGRWMDNVFIERVWRSLKTEEVYLHEYTSLKQARDGIRQYFEFYNNDRPHQSLGYKPPALFYELKASEAEKL